MKIIPAVLALATLAAPSFSQSQSSPSISASDNSNALFSIMMEYQKTLAEEAKQDRLLKHEAAALQREKALAELKRHTDALQAAKQQSLEKQRQALNAAVAGFNASVISGAALGSRTIQQAHLKAKFELEKRHQAIGDAVSQGAKFKLTPAAAARARL